MATPCQDDVNDTECYIFIDHSNLWIAGKEQHGKSLVDADSDPRYRVNLGSFVEIVRKNRSITKAHLYGSRPPPNDAVWNAAKKLNFEVSIFDRSITGKEKEVDVTMATHITKTAYKFDKESGRCAVFIVITGDRDMRTPIEEALSESELISVELWSWESSLAREYRLLANTADRFQVWKLDTIKLEFSYVQFKSSRPPKDMDPRKMAIYKEVPNTKSFFYQLANELCLLSRIFYISRTRRPEQPPDTVDLVVEFTNSNIEHVFKQLRKSTTIVPISYPEYTSLRMDKLAIRVASRFEAVGSIDDVVPEAMNIEPDDLDSSQDEPGNEWDQVIRRKPGMITKMLRIKKTPCQWGDHCAAGLACKHAHTEEEKKIFENKHTAIKYRKTKMCPNKDQHTNLERQKACQFAHDNHDSWCLKCKAYGHLTEKCKG